MVAFEVQINPFFGIKLDVSSRESLGSPWGRERERSESHEDRWPWTGIRYIYLPYSPTAKLNPRDLKRATV